MKHTLLVLSIMLPAICWGQLIKPRKPYVKKQDWRSVSTFDVALCKPDAEQMKQYTDAAVLKYLPSVPQNMICSEEAIAAYRRFREQSFVATHNTMRNRTEADRWLGASIKAQPEYYLYALHSLDCDNIPYYVIKDQRMQWQHNIVANQKKMHECVKYRKPFFTYFIATIYKERAEKELQRKEQLRQETNMFLRARSAHINAVKKSTPKVRRLLRCGKKVDDELLWALAREASKYCGIKVSLKDAKFEMKKLRQYAKRHGVYSRSEVLTLSKDIRYYEETMRDIWQGIRGEGCQKLRTIRCGALDVILNAIPEVPRPRPPRDLRTYKDGRNQDYINRQYRIKHRGK